MRLTPKFYLVLKLFSGNKIEIGGVSSYVDYSGSTLRDLLCAVVRAHLTGDLNAVTNVDVGFHSVHV